MFYTVYKITNLVNEKIYVGVHKTKDLNDEYMGSGNLIKKAIEKYEIENFKKEYISIFDNAEDMFKMESELVNEDFLERTDVYNLKSGGFGGWDYVNKYGNPNRTFSMDCILKGVESRKWLFENDEDWLKRLKKTISIAVNEYYLNGGINGFSGKRHTEETKRKMGEANSKHQSGKGNSQYGTMWIYNLELKENKKIKKDEFSSWEQDGCLKGRKMKF